jgi:hypothetical protein
MAEPENHTLRLLREFREETRGFREEMGDFRADMREFQVQTDRALNKVTTDISEIKDKLDTLTRAVAGEIVQSRYVSAAIDDRFAEIERRLSALEQSR